MSDMLGNALAEVAGPMKDFWTKLAGSDCTMWLTAFKRFLRKENPWTSKFSVRWTVTLGIHKTPKAYEQALESAGFKIGDWARDILKKVKCSKEQIEVNLASATVAELGFQKGASTADLYSAILAQGGQLCPAEVGPALRLFLKDQPKNEWLWIAMEAISVSCGDLGVFSVDHRDAGLWLDSGSGPPVNRWGPGHRVVFVVPSQVS